jgi:trans-aconitate methyltransferase
MGSGRREPDWVSLLKSWDAQQESFNPERDRRFSAMLDAVGATTSKRFTALDLGSGPGSLSLRLLRRFPGARVIAVDYDPVTLRIGEGALGNYGGRLTWVDAKLGARGWTDRLPRRKVDVVVSTTALHWLPRSGLRTLYKDLGRILRPGGVFLNGDHLPWGTASRGLSRLAESVRRERFEGATLDDEWTAWRKWWERAEKIPALRPYFEEHKRRAAQHPHQGDLPLSVHENALRRAGFRELAVIWQDFENRILFARR